MQRTNSMLIVSTKPKNLNPTNYLLVDYLKLFPFIVLQRFTFVLVLLCIIVSCYSVMADCDCTPGKGWGCSIVKPAAPGFACYCYPFGFGACGGRDVACRDSSSHYCHNPDHSIQSCFLGGGNCGGY
jgi:hypothetical protein